MPIDSSEYNPHEWESLCKNSRFTHVRVYLSDYFRVTLHEFFSSELEDRFIRGAGAALSEFSGRVAVNPKNEPDFDSLVRALFHGFLEFVDTYSYTMEENAYVRAYNVFAERMTINLFSTKCKEKDEEVRFLTVSIDLIPLNVYDDEALFQEFSSHRAAHELKLNTIH